MLLCDVSNDIGHDSIASNVIQSLLTHLPQL